MPTTHSKDPVATLLEKILMVLAIQAAANQSISQGARLLKIAGLDNVTIARLLGTDPKTVSTLTTGARAASHRTRRRRRAKAPARKRR